MRAETIPQRVETTHARRGFNLPEHLNEDASRPCVVRSSSIPFLACTCVSVGVQSNMHIFASASESSHDASAVHHWPCRYESCDGDWGMEDGRDQPPCFFFYARIDSPPSRSARNVRCRVYSTLQYSALYLQQFAVRSTCTSVCRVIMLGHGPSCRARYRVRIDRLTGAILIRAIPCLRMDDPTGGMMLISASRNFGTCHRNTVCTVQYGVQTEVLHTEEFCMHDTSLEECRKLIPYLPTIQYQAESSYRALGTVLYSVLRTVVLRLSYGTEYEYCTVHTVRSTEVWST
jgi:hypothetical protein